MPDFTLKFSSETIVAHSVDDFTRQIDVLHKTHPDKKLVSVVCLVLLEEHSLESLKEHVVDG